MNIKVINCIVILTILALIFPALGYAGYIALKIFWPHYLTIFGFMFLIVLCAGLNGSLIIWNIARLINCMED